ncbi:MAG: hypothetical protein A2W23_08050 [Planctomycetes bacterium RBG_16_43_13]|nr:MAG: hypothetical protein A2W23_08050 [Planctomycetes bacterium RBG_16_43_13]
MGSDMKQNSLYTYMLHRMKHLFIRSSLRQLWIGVTYDCQCSCEHCLIGSELNKKMNELSRAEIQRILRDARSLGVRRVSYFGGEPLMRDDLTDLIGDAHGLGLGTTIFTNGILLGKEYVQRLKGAGLERCNVSLDFPDSQSHDLFRHYKGCFETAVEGIRLLVDSGISASIWTHVSKNDVSKNGLKDLKRLIQMGRDLGVSNVMVLFPYASGKWLCGWDEILTQEERNRVRELFDPPFVRIEFPDEMSTCTAGRLFVYIKPQGDVTPCPTVDHAFGNVHKESLRSIIRRIERTYCCLTSDHHGDCVLNNTSFREKLSLTSFLK